MKVAKHNSGLIIGVISTVISLCLTATYVIPIISVLFGVILETVASGLVNNDPYSNVGKLTIQLLSVTFLFTLILCLLSVANKTEKMGYISQRRIIGIMAIMYFIVHALGFYIYWGVALNFRSDGQLIFSAMISFPFSSFAFVLIGILIDFVKKSALLKYTESAGRKNAR